ncbi:MULTISPECIES: hypothetical protein [Chryseobacterium]|uniref:Molecular chaperone GroES n=1 Tax=Chryseobacterium camelliae TaxID=1265445 RepID=A0ABU0TLG3_9FLAO|nr:MULTISPECIES: hypothetical protein [Chryseobacterium]MDT3408257.1 hypothetical protein [Pseudacidovorax intermedius]MDQ1097888.1 hypothetical protein [Chryseobacterium camelliae]MDQ1101822.1 hypothetical protein [Chryseobacterium sp. SORGH_AS_1048]MDR6085260.1 hypothetical protein [Chryseobacterium sp. SORGH_AS_0909]MDR6129619.1 hypothetical protein [Chryseobacterium sp. SORGH_AS_1175]
MRKSVFIALFFCIQIVSAQKVYLTKVEKTNDNTDKFFYTLNNGSPDAEYLGEIEVQGYSKDDAAVFSMIYKKAKEIGANAFAWKPFENVEGKPEAFNPSNYRLALYYVPKEKISDQAGNLYLFASSDKDQKIAVNGKDYIIAPRSYLKLQVVPNQVYAISTKKLLGSSIKVQPKSGDQNMYFQVSSAKIKADNSGIGGLNLKSGDIIGLEQSFAEFLSVIYDQIKLD